MKIIIVGPTGVGKTKLSIELAKWLDGIIINADAVQIYKELNIGSAKIKEEEKEEIPHYLLDIRTPDQDYTVKDYQIDTRNIFKENNKNMIMVGGTGLYICGSLMDYRFLEDNITDDLSKYSNEEIYELALKKDPNCNIDKNNRVRLERFIKKDEVDVEPKLLYDDCLFIGLTTSRDHLYKIINQRVDDMFKKGLIEEVTTLYQKYPDSKILNRAIGYKEIILYLNNLIDLDSAKDLIKKNSRHYAKRQYTWFNNKMDVKWFDVDYDDFNKTIEEVKKYIKEELK